MSKRSLFFCVLWVSEAWLNALHPQMCLCERRSRRKKKTLSRKGYDSNRSHSRPAQCVWPREEAPLVTSRTRAVWWNVKSAAEGRHRGTLGKNCKLPGKCQRVPRSLWSLPERCGPTRGWRWPRTHTHPQPTLINAAAHSGRPACLTAP